MHAFDFYTDRAPECHIETCPSPKNIIDDSFDKKTKDAQIDTLRAQVETLQTTLERCIRIVNNLQSIIDSDLYQFYKELRSHTKGFHSMLIIGNKEKKDEGNIS